MQYRQHLGPVAVFVSTHHFRIGIGVNHGRRIAEEDVLIVLVLLIRFIISREHYRVGMDNLVVYGTSSVQRAGIVIEVSGNTDAQFGCSGYIDVDVGPGGICPGIYVVVK